LKTTVNKKTPRCEKDVLVAKEGGLLVRLRWWENVRERGVRRGDLHGGVEGLSQIHNNERGKYSVSKNKIKRKI
jgi:hypothetical protein